ncbi:gamma-glutamyl-gamma-aminobutyrate hydrolase family protein [Streptomyces sp. HNM0574]|uniref:gamma-glutamyl-gamma-aminobutyrate hydrolase family protein n=1 Tax=Streptomyces sp. HNM0574 TaxID=2714954 RepID=UPI00146D1661|nr:gamma-glutamyl-gamma-aminobutyrate hydrolase family protein [Streptomyces sp. HNM0574]
MTRPLIALPQRFSPDTAVLRYAAVVTARALAEAVYRAGGEPLMLLPHAPGGRADEAEAAARLARCDALLLPGGGDFAPHHYAGAEAAVHAAVYDVDEEQDAFDLALTRAALASPLPVLAVCRGLQAVNIALGGTLRQDMGGPGRAHRHLVHPVATRPGSRVSGVLGTDKAEVSCHHHQCVDAPGRGLTVTARAADGTPEALELPGRRAWFTAVQWHPEDTAATDPAQQALFTALVEAAR